MDLLEVDYICKVELKLYHYVFDRIGRAINKDGEKDNV